MVYRVHLACAGFELTMLVVIGTDCISSYKSNYHAITVTHKSSEIEKLKTQGVVRHRICFHVVAYVLCKRNCGIENTRHHTRLHRILLKILFHLPLVARWWLEM